MNRAIVYGAVTAILAGVLAAASAVSQRVFIEITGDRSDVAVIVTTLVVATLYAPVRTRVEDAVDRYFKYEQRRFGRYRAEIEQLADLVDPRRAAARLARETVAETGARGAAVVDASSSVIASSGDWPVDVVARLAIDGPSPLSAILVGPRPDGRALDHQALDDLAVVAATLGSVLR